MRTLELAAAEDDSPGEPILAQVNRDCSVLGSDLEHRWPRGLIAPPTIWLYPIETHITEKLHAYTMPRIRLSSPTSAHWTEPVAHSLECVRPCVPYR